MTRSLVLVVAFVIAPAVVWTALPQRAAAAAAAEEDKSAELVGEWEVVSLESNGKAADKEQLKGMAATFEKEKLTLRPSDAGRAQRAVTEKVTYTTRAGKGDAKAPREIDMKFITDPNQPVDIRGIYVVEGKTLKLCFEAIETGGGTATPGTGRPTAFAAKAGSGHALLTLERKAAGK